MKSKIAVFLTIIMLVTMIIPLHALAASDKSLEDAIKIAKAKFTVPDSYSVFNYDINTQGVKKVWNLNWNSKDTSEGGISIRVDDKGNILSYNCYKNRDYLTRKFPKISKQDAKAKAEEFIREIVPQVLPNIKYIDNNQTSLMEPFYNFNYIRIVNNIPFPSDSISVSINCQTGELQNYYYAWTDDITFPDATNAISLNDAFKAYEKNLGLRLTYSYFTDGENAKAYPTYTSKYNANYYYIDALTGERLYTGNIQYGGRGREYFDKANASLMNATAEVAMPVLSPEELKSVEEASKLITQEQAEKAAKSFKVLELTDDFKVSSATLGRNWPEKNEFVWNLYFAKQVKGDSNFDSLNVRIDAKTGEVKGFFRSGGYNGDEKAKYTETDARKAAEDFLKEVQPVKFGETEYDTSYDEAIYIQSEKPTFYNFRFIRKVNGVPFPDNSLTVEYNAVSGKITNYDTTWYKLDFPAVDKVMPISDIYEKMFSEIGLELQYKAEFEYNTLLSAKGIRSPDTKPTIKLVYGIKSIEKPISFDANTGIILNYDGTPYKESKPIEYTDIAGNFAERQIKVLAQFGISLEGIAFKPDESITQKDFLLLLSKGVNNLYLSETSDKNKETEQLYNVLIRAGVIKQSEKAPESQITREEAVKFVVRALKFDKVADIKGIFNCQFKDKDNIAPELMGYVVIASGFGIVAGDGENFNPKGKLTRAEAMVVIYNYLQI